MRAREVTPEKRQKGKLRFMMRARCDSVRKTGKMAKRRIEISKYTNTQIHKYTRCRRAPRACASSTRRETRSTRGTVRSASPGARSFAGAGRPGGAAARTQARIDSGTAPVILDVRSVEEYDEGHIQGAVNIIHTDIAASLAALPLLTIARS